MDIKVENLTHIYRSQFSPECKAVSEVSLSIPSGEFLAIVGSTGSGKTTLIQHMNGILQPTYGRIIVDGQNISTLDTKVTKIRMKIGLVFQFPENQLFAETVYDDVAFGPKNLGLLEGEIEKRVNSALSLVGLDFDEFRSRSPFGLSTGEKRRVAIAGILAMDPRVLILDEPTAGLDGKSSDMIEKLLIQYNQKGKTVIFVSHDMDFVSRLARRVVVMHRGSVIFDGNREDLFREEKLLDRAGLIMPEIPRYMRRLKLKGYRVRTDIFTLEEAKRELERVGKIG